MYLNGSRIFLPAKISIVRSISVESGVPRGSVLFLYYTNDLVDNLEYTLLLFADNVKIYKEIRSLADAEALIRDMKRIEE